MDPSEESRISSYLLGYKTINIDQDAKSLRNNEHKQTSTAVPSASQARAPSCPKCPAASAPRSPEPQRPAPSLQDRRSTTRLNRSRLVPLLSFLRGGPSFFVDENPPKSPANETSNGPGHPRSDSIPPEIRNGHRLSVRTSVERRPFR